MVAYAPLHIRSHYSFHDSLLSVRTIIARATELGLPAVGLTDPNLHAAVEFFLAAREAGLQPILGAEVTPAPDRAAPLPRPVLLYVRDANKSNLFAINSTGLSFGNNCKTLIS